MRIVISILFASVLLIVIGTNNYNNKGKYYVVDSSPYAKYRKYNMCFFDIIEEIDNKRDYRIVHSAFLLTPPTICNHISKTIMNMYGYYIISHRNEGRSTLIANIYVATYENKCWRQNFGSDKVIIAEHVFSSYYECGYLSELIGESINVFTKEFCTKDYICETIYIDSHHIYFNNLIDSTYSVLYLENDTVIGYFTEYNCLIDSGRLDSFMIKLHLNLRRQALREKSVHKW